MSSPVTATVNTAADTAMPAALSNGLANSGLPIDFAALLLSAQGVSTALDPSLVDAANGGAMTDDGESADDALASSNGDPTLLLAAFLPNIIPPAISSASRVGGQDGSATNSLSGSDGLKIATEQLTDKLRAGEDSTVANALGADADTAAILADAAKGAGNDAPRFDTALAHAMPNSNAPRENTSAANAGTATAHVATPLNDARWGDDFAQRLVWMARNDIQTAQLSINPGNLGPIEVTLNLGGEQATAVFSSPFSDVRETLENALPRLREMFSEAGIELGQAHVNAQSQRDPREETTNRAGAGAGNSGGILRDTPAASGHAIPLRMQRGLVDTFA